MSTVDIALGRLLLGYGLLVLPLGICLWLRLPLLGRIGLAVLRMSVQLLLVGLYLQVLFARNSVWLNVLWVAVMLTVADASILRNSGLRLRCFGGPLFLGLLIGTAVPVAVFLGVILGILDLSQAQYVVPITGMVLGNCLRANVVGLSRFYHDLRTGRRRYELSLAQGAVRAEALRPFLRAAFQAALGPTTATMATAGLVALPGMMTGAMLGGVDPLLAIKYQIAIMLGIFASTALTVWVSLALTARTSFDDYGLLRDGVFAAGGPA